MDSERENFGEWLRGRDLDRKRVFEKPGHQITFDEIDLIFEEEARCATDPASPP